ncbi:hypothetical protein PENTCL1PPCAC_15569, partial [Pristionchus entomophagus]
TIVSGCKMCALDLITKTVIGNGAHVMDMDVPNPDGTCLTRTFTCLGKNANIEVSWINGGDGVVGDDGSNVATFTVTCNPTGTGWVSNGVTITQVECAAEPPCKTCAMNLITITMAGNGAKPMASDVTNMDGDCNMRTFTCTGANANIEVSEINGGDGAILDNGTGTAAFTVTCNPTGTAWTASGIDITQVECAADN